MTGFISLLEGKKTYLVMIIIMIYSGIQKFFMPELSVPTEAEAAAFTEKAVLWLNNTYEFWMIALAFLGGVTRSAAKRAGYLARKFGGAQ